MKALLMKDACVLWRHMRIFVLVLVVMALTGGAYNSIFIVVWCSMLPYTAMAYDERSHWDQMAAMMPYSRRDIVLSKYVLGWICMGASIVMSVVVQSAAVFVGRSGPEASMLLTSLFAGIISLDITLPMILRFGVERGRMIFMLVIFGVAILGSAAANVVGEIGKLPQMAAVLVPAIAVIATVISIPLSMKLYKVN